MDIEERVDHIQGEVTLIKGEIKLTDSTDNLRRREDLNDLYFSLAADGQ